MSLSSKVHRLRNHDRRLSHQRVWLLLFLLAIIPPTMAERQKIHFSCLASPSFPGYSQLEKLYRDSFDQLGFDFQMTLLSEPEIDNAFQKSLYDGDCARLDGFFDEEYQQNYLLLNTSTATMKINIYGSADIHSLPLDQLIAATQPNFDFLPTLARHYNIKVMLPVNSMQEVWNLWRKKKINAYIGISYLFPTSAPVAQDLELEPQYSLVKYPLQPALKKSWAPIQPALERILSHKFNSPAEKPVKHTAIEQTSNSEETKAVTNAAITFGCPIASNTKTFIDLEKFFSDVFSSLGLTFQMREMPRSREAHALITGTIDGSCGRIHVPPSSTAPLRLPILITEDRLELWSTKLQPLSNSLKQLPERSRLAYRRGLLTQRQLLATDHITFLPQQLAHNSLIALTEGKADYAADLHVQIDNNMANITTKKPLYLSGILGRVQVAPYLSHQHQQLVDPLTLAMKARMGDHETVFGYIYNTP